MNDNDLQSSNNLDPQIQMIQSNRQKSISGCASSSFSRANSLYQFDLLGEVNKKQIESNSVVTKFLKQSSDNISNKETHEHAKMVSIGCQTISTGEVSVTNVYIE
jgi:hypothetical protein